MRLLDDLGWELEVDGEAFELTLDGVDLAAAVSHLIEQTGAPSGRRAAARPARAGWPLITAAMRSSAKTLRTIVERCPPSAAL